MQNIANCTLPNILSDSEDTVRSVIQHLQTSYSGFDYNPAKCTRDIGYIIDAAQIRLDA